MNLTQNEKATLALQSLSDSCQILAERSGRVLHAPGYDAYKVPETFWYQRVCLLPQAKTSPAETIAEIAQKAKAGQLPPLLGFLEPDFTEEELAGPLTEAGYVPMVKQTGMWLSLEGREKTAWEEKIQVVEPQQVESWTAEVAAAFGKPPEPGLRALAEEERCVFLRWMEEGKMVAGTLLMWQGELAGIHEVATLPQHRRKGIAGKLVEQALEMARERGCRYATLQASELGKPVYERLGFEEAGILHTWLLKPGS